MFQNALSIGIVKNNNDPMQQGRLQVYIPSWDADNYVLADLPWCWYITPMGGTAVGIKAGREEHESAGITTYGMWAIPDIGAQVLVCCLDGNQEMRAWLGCMYTPELNRTLPSGIDGVTSEIDPSGQYGQHTFDYMQTNLTDAGLWKNTKHWKTRGGWARSVSYPANGTIDKPATNGYSPNPNQPEVSDSQIMSWTTQGRHHIAMSDVKEESRIRFKTQQGNQIILDDTNERIYISTAKGRNWVELDETNGKIYVYSDSKISINSRNDINLHSEENINIVAKKRVNIKSEERAVVVQAKHDIRLLSTDADIMLTASRDINLKTTDGPTAPSVASTQSCDQNRHGNPGGKTYIYNWAEKGGSSTSSIRFDSAQELNGLAQSPINLTSASKISLRSAGSLNMSASFIGHTASGVGWSVGDTGLMDTDNEEDGPDMVIPRVGAEAADSAPPTSGVQAETILDHMILPKHESWTRDEDEVNCKTPRGPNYQG